MTRSTRVVVALLMALVLAACSGGAGPTPGPTTTPTSTSTPAATEGTVPVPDIVDETEQDGLVALGAAGLSAGTKSRAFSDSIDSGRIISTDPRAGVIVASGTAIDYVVSRGPAPTPSPTPKRTPSPTPTRTPKPTPTRSPRPTEVPTPAPVPTPPPILTPPPVLTPPPILTPPPPPTEAPNPVPTPAASPAEIPLPGTAWVLAKAVEDASTDIALPEGLVFTAVFSDTQVSGTAACSQYTAPYTVQPGGVITIGEAVVSAGTCPGDDGTAQTQYLDALRASTSYQATTTRLQLTAADGTRLVYSPATPEASPSTSPGG